MSRDLNLTRPSSRVLAQPGGNSSFSLGGYDEAPVEKRVQQPQQQQQIQQPATFEVKENAVPVQSVPAAVVKPVENEFSVTGAKQSTRVRQAPGGTSSIVFG